VTLVNLEDVVADPEVQQRQRMDMATVMEYAGEMRAGAQFPPVKTFFDGERYWLADGFHRYEAAKMCGHTVLNADIQEGTRRDAILMSAGANATHGLRRTNDDKRRAVQTLLRDDAWRLWSDREIARRCAVSAPFVGQVRKAMEPEIGARPAEVKAKRDGQVYTMRTENIGQEQEKEYGGLEKQETINLLEEAARETPVAVQATLSEAKPEPVPQKLEMQPATTEVPTLEMESSEQGVDTLIQVRVHAGPVLAERAVTLTIADEFKIGKWHKGHYAELGALLNQACHEHFEEDGDGKDI